MKVAGEKKKQLLSVYLLLSAIFSSVVIVIFFLAWKNGVELSTAIVLASLLLFLINSTFALGYRSNLRSPEVGEKHDESQGGLRKKVTGYWLLTSSLILLAVTIFGFILIFLKKMVIIGTGTMVLSAVTFIFLLNKRQKGNTKNLQGTS